MSNYEVALEEVLLEEFSWINNVDSSELNHRFSKDFEFKMNKVFKMPEYTYVNVERKRLRKSVVIAIIAALIFTFSGCAIVVHHLVVTWNETNNFDTGTIDVTFDIENKSSSDQFKYIEPNVPQGFSITNTDKQDSNYSIEYENATKELIIYSQDFYVENMSLSIDNEASNLTEIQVNNYKGYSYTKGEMNAIIWTDGIYLFTLQGTCKMSILDKMTESIL